MNILNKKYYLENGELDTDKVISKIKELENQDDFKSIRLPCIVGDDIYVIPNKMIYDLNIAHNLEKNNRVTKQKVASIVLHENDKYEFWTCNKTKYLTNSTFGTDWFLTEKEANLKLSEMIKNEMQ